MRQHKRFSYEVMIAGRQHRCQSLRRLKVLIKTAGCAYVIADRVCRQPGVFESSRIYRNCNQFPLDLCGVHRKALDAEPHYD